MLSGALPVIRLDVDGRECSALVDTGCTDTIVHVDCCKEWRPHRVPITTMSGDRLCCRGVGRVSVRLPDGHEAQLEVLVVEEKPMGVDVVLGMTGITSLGGVNVRNPADVRFCGAAVRPPLAVDTTDFVARFDADQCEWTVAWKWTGGVGPECLTNTVAQYAVAPDVRVEFDQEIDVWIEKGWLRPYDEREDGPPRGLVPLMAVRQTNQDKVRPVLDYRELNGYVTAHTADADVCADQLRKWRRHGAHVAVVDLRKAYLQLRLDRRLWPYQTVVVRGRRFCLTRLGFGLNIAPLVMKAVVRAVLSQDPVVERAVLPYVDDLLVNEDIISADRVVQHFSRFGLACKPPQRPVDGARMLGLRVRREMGVLHWTRDNGVPAPPARLTRRAVFAWCGKLVSHLPVCGWLRPAAAWLKRRANAVTGSWDDVTDDAALRAQVAQVHARLDSADPARGQWCWTGGRATVWTDASSIATGVVIETPDGGVMEDACWLRPVDAAATHINMAELDAAIRGLNLAVAWGVKDVDLRTDSATVHRWIDDAISGRARLRTKAQSEMLIRRRVDIIRQLVEELQLTVVVSLVRSGDNRADALTRVPREWLRSDGLTAGCAVGNHGDVVSHGLCGEDSGTGCAALSHVTAEARELTDDAACGRSVGAGDASADPASAGVRAPAGGACPSSGACRSTGACVAAGRGDSQAWERHPTRGGDAGAVGGCDSRVRECRPARGEVPDAVADIEARIVAVHERAGHPGIRRTLYFARRDVSRRITRVQVRSVVQECDVCRSVDPAPVRWRHGSLGVAATWSRLAIDVTHYKGKSYLSVIDCGPSRFAVWRQLRRPDATEISGHLDQLFMERGAPAEVLADNDTVFRGRQVAALAARWGVALRFRAVHEPGGNGIVERSHRTVKVIAARRDCSIAEAVHIYNATPRDGERAETAPAAGIFRYALRDCVRPARTDDRAQESSPRRPAPASDRTRPQVGDQVWMRRRGTRCTEVSRRGTVTRVVSPQVVEVDGVPWHVRDVRPRYEEEDGVAADGAEPPRDGGALEVCEPPPLVVAGRPEDGGAAGGAEPSCAGDALEPREPPGGAAGGAEPPSDGDVREQDDDVVLDMGGGDEAGDAAVPPEQSQVVAGRRSARTRRPVPLRCSCADC